MGARILLLSLMLSFLDLPPARGSSGTVPGLEPVVAGVARWAVAIQVKREEEPAAVSRLPVKSAVRIPQDVVDYYRRPPGPATGLLLDARGNILTSYYNVAGVLKSIEVVFPSGARLPARLVATDKSDDLALLRTDDPPPGLEVPPVPWADPGRLLVGRIVIAVGRSPDPASPTATFGIISAVGRNGGRVFQTDAELNYGNVGGPIADLDGSIVGLASFVGHTYSMWGLNSGIGFGTRADTIRDVLPKLLSGESVSPPDRPYMGVGASRQPAPGNVGARIGQVESNGAADRAGLKVDDVIVAFEGERVEDFMDLRRLINRRRPGDEVTVKVDRGSRQLELKVKLGKRPE